MKYLRTSYLNSYELCPYLTKELYGDLSEDAPKEYNADDDEQGFYAEFGKILHELFEKWGRAKMKKEKYVQEQMVTDYEKSLVTLKNNYPDGKEQDYILSGYEQIEYFYNKYSSSIPIGVELRFPDIKLIDKIPLPFTGTLDRIEGIPEKQYIDLYDYKTGSHIKYTKAELKDNIQTTVYSLYIRSKYGFFPKTFSFLFTKTKKERTINITEDFIRRGIERIYRDYLRMESGLWEPTGNHSDYFCQNFCESKTCPKKHRSRNSGWGELKKTGKPPDFLKK